MVFRSLKANQHRCRLTLARLLRGGLLDGLSLLADPLGRAGAAAGSPSGARRAAPSAGRRVGVPQPLTRDSRTVRHANGRYTTTIYPGSVNYRTPSGWRPIDSSLVAAGEAGFAWRNKANRFTASFARR